ncbi:MAG: hypothetical protein IPL61_03775 [Myxococcales bacterium]|nr:hypothetical protein [Myxococcales bacterium]
MTEVRFHKDVYDGRAVDAALQQFARYARLEAIEEPSYWVVRVSAATPARERTVAGELGNQALGATSAGRKAVAP